MDNCLVCKGDVAIKPQEWSGGRMTVECPLCGGYEIGPGLYEELLPLPENHWTIERVRSGFAEISEPRMIRKPSSNIVEVVPVGADKPTDLQKRSLRAKAEGRTVTGGSIVQVGAVDDVSGN